MLSQLLRQLTASFGIFFRTIRAFFTRRLMGVTSYLRRITNFSRQATKVASASVQGAAAAVKKPTRREDYIETERLFISKSFLILTAIALVLLGLFCYYGAWPFILSRFLTARFYCGDSRVPDWTGKVIVYSDREKRVPMYSGRLEEGVLQGEGKRYDEDGLVAYEGGFSGGVPTGNGTGYEAGVLVYEGQFQNGVYEGAGKLYEGGRLVYRGEFSRGLPNGMGTAYSGEEKCYEGQFVDGLYEGTGVAYDAAGTPRYKGSFSAGVYEGEGTAYGETGRVRYWGSFSGGLYDGDGTLYLAGGDSIHSEFTAGEAGDVIQWYKGGRLWYDGGADNLTPDGFGTLYARSGRVIYAGEMDRGSLDGQWLLTLTADELREAFGEASVTETGRTGSGYLIVNNSLGLSALCTFREGEEESNVYRVWFSPEEGSSEEALLPWTRRMDAETWARRDRDTMLQSRRSRGTVFLPSGGTGGDWYQSVFYYEDHARSLVSEEKESAPFQIIWARTGGLDIPAADVTDEAAAGAQEKLDELLGALEHVGGSGGGPAGTAADPADVERLLELMLTPQDAYSLMNALADCYSYGRMAEALEASRPLLEQVLVERRRQLERDQSTQAAVDSAQDALDALDRQLVQYRVVEEQAKLIGEKLTGLKLDGYDLAAVLQVFDVEDLDVEALYDAALAYAGELAAGRYPVDEAQLELDVKTQALDLISARETVRAGQQSLERAAALLEEAAQGYAMGTADKESLYGAQCAANEAAAGLFQSMGAYTKLVNRLNDLSGGWLAERLDWFAEPFGVLYDTAVRQARDEAEAEKQQSADPPPGESREIPGETDPPPGESREVPGETDPAPSGGPGPEGGEQAVG